VVDDLDTRSAQTEALTVQRIGEFRFSSDIVPSKVDLATQIIEKKVKQEFRGRMGPTAKLDITSQAYDVLDQHMPELTKAMRDEVEGKAKVAEYFWADYVPLPVEVSGRHLTHEERVKYAQLQPHDRICFLSSIFPSLFLEILGL
jgi:hypothetical protein